VGPRAGLHGMAMIKNPTSCWELRSSRSARSLVTVLTELPRFTIKKHAPNWSTPDTRFEVSTEVKISCCGLVGRDTV